MENVGPLLGGVPFVPPCTGWNIWVNQTPRPVVFVEVRSVVPGTSSDLQNWRTSRGRVKYVNVIKISNYFVIYVSCLCSNDKMEKSRFFLKKSSIFSRKQSILTGENALHLPLTWWPLWENDAMKHPMKISYHLAINIILIDFLKIRIGSVRIGFSKKFLTYSDFLTKMRCSGSVS